MIRRVVSYVTDDQSGQAESVPPGYLTATIKGRAPLPVRMAPIETTPAETTGSGSGGSGGGTVATRTATAAPAPVPAPGFDLMAFLSQQFGPFTLEQWLLIAAAGAAAYFLFFNKKR